MTILHKCSKTHGRYLVLLVTSWLRLKAEKCDRICWEGLWCRPVAQAWTRMPAAQATLRCGRHSSDGPPPHPVRALCTEASSAGPARRAAPSWLLATLWGGAGRGRRSCVCCEHGFCPLSGTGPLAAPSLKALPGSPSASHRGPQPSTVLGAEMSRAGQGRNGQQQEAGFAPGCLMTGDPCYGDRQEDGGGALPRPPMPSDPFLDRLSRPRAQPLRTPRLGLEEPQVGSTPSTGAGATGGTRTQPTTEPCLLNTQKRSASI